MPLTLSTQKLLNGSGQIVTYKGLIKKKFYSSLRIRQVACCIRTPPFPPSPPLQASYLTHEFFTHQVQGLPKLQGVIVEPGSNLGETDYLCGHNCVSSSLCSIHTRECSSRQHSLWVNSIIVAVWCQILIHFFYFSPIERKNERPHFVPTIICSRILFSHY